MAPEIAPNPSEIQQNQPKHPEHLQSLFDRNPTVGRFAALAEYDEQKAQATAQKFDNIKLNTESAGDRIKQRLTELSFAGTGAIGIAISKLAGFNETDWSTNIWVGGLVSFVGERLPHGPEKQEVSYDDQIQSFYSELVTDAAAKVFASENPEVLGEKANQVQNLMDTWVSTRLDHDRRAPIDQTLDTMTPTRNRAIDWGLKVGLPLVCSSLLAAGKTIGIDTQGAESYLAGYGIWNAAIQAGKEITPSQVKTNYKDNKETREPGGRYHEIILADFREALQSNLSDEEPAILAMRNPAKEVIVAQTVQTVDNTLEDVKTRRGDPTIASITKSVEQTRQHVQNSTALIEKILTDNKP